MTSGPHQRRIDSSPTFLTLFVLAKVPIKVSYCRRLRAEQIAYLDPSRLICHLTSTCRMRPLLIDMNFSPSLVHLTAHPPVLPTHVASAYLTPPPLSSSGDTSPDDVKFWRVFLPLSERTHEIEALVFGAEGEGGGGGGLGDEFVVEVLVRGRNNDRQITVASGSRRRGVERSLGGWSTAKGGPVPLESLESLKSAFRKVSTAEKVR